MSQLESWKLLGKSFCAFIFLLYLCSTNTIEELNRITEHTTNMLTLSKKLGETLLNYILDSYIRPALICKCSSGSLLPSLNWRQGFIMALFALPLAFVSCGKTQIYFPEWGEYKF